MNTRRRYVGATGIVALTALFGILFADQLPEQVAMHFGPEGQPDDYMAKPYALALLPALQLILLGVFAALPRLDPLGENIREFRRAYDAFVVLMIAFLGYVHGLVVLWNVGSGFSVLTALVPAIAVVYFAIGSVVERAEQNWFVGFRTPWTLSNEQVWDDTHAIGASLMKGAAVITLGGLLFPEYALEFIVGPVVVVAVVTTVYSYWDYRQVSTSRA